METQALERYIEENTKSELEIRELHEKIDHLIIHYQQDLLEIQKTQIDLLENILHNVKKE